MGRRALAVLLIGVLLTLGAGAFGAGVFDSLSQGGFDDASSESARELDAEREAFVADYNRQGPAGRPAPTDA